MENINVVTKEFITKNNLPTITNFDDATKEGTYKVDNSISSNTSYPSLLVVTVKDNIIKQTHYDNNGDIKGREYNGSWSEFTKINKAAESATPTNNNVAIDLYWNYETIDGELVYKINSNDLLDIFKKYEVIRITIKAKLGGSKRANGMTEIINIPINIYKSEMNTLNYYLYSPLINIPVNNTVMIFEQNIYSYLPFTKITVSASTDKIKLPFRNMEINSDGSCETYEAFKNHYIQFI